MIVKMDRAVDYMSLLYLQLLSNETINKQTNMKIYSVVTSLLKVFGKKNAYTYWCDCHWKIMKYVNINIVTLPSKMSHIDTSC